MCIRDTETGSETSPETLGESYTECPRDSLKVLQEGTSREEKKSDKNKREGAAGEDQSCSGEDHTILQFLVLREGPIWEHTCSSEHCPGVLQHLREARLG